MTKACSCCKQVLPFSAFYKAAKAKTGYANRCKACDLEYQRARKTEKAEANTRWRVKHGAAYNENKRQQTKARREAYLQSKIATDLSVWRKQQAARALQKAKATPAWVDREHHERIRNVYAVTQMLQEATAMVYHVDHIVPLVSDVVCGLHVWWNLQPMPEATNVLKNNNFDPRFYPEQGVVAFPSNDGLPPAQSAVLLKVEKSDE